MAASGSVMYLPNEILEFILEHDNLTFKDVCNFGSTCSKLRSVVNNSNSVWKRKFLQRWPGMRDVFNRHKAYDWKEHCKNYSILSVTVRQHVGSLSRKFYRKEEISNCELGEFGKMMNDQEFGYQFIINELMSITSDGDKATNLTEKYYAEKVIRYVRHLHLMYEWQKFLEIPPEDQLLEKGAVLVAQWCQPMVEVTYECIALHLDTIANEVKAALNQDHPNHPLFSASPENLQRWRNKNIDNNQWNPTESQLIIQALRKVLFSDMGFYGNNEMYYAAENSFINMVLEQRRGIPITLSIVFESVARRLGVRCEPVSFPAHFLLRWKERYDLPVQTSEPAHHYYIDVFNGGQFLTKRNCPRYSAEGQCPMKGISVQPASTLQVVERMANNLEVAGRQRTHMNGRGARLRSALELLNLVNPTDMNCILHLARFYMLYNMDLTDLMAMLGNMQNELPQRSREQANNIMQMLQVYETHHNTNTNRPEVIEAKMRSESVLYAVGMVMRHKQYNYNCVIFGWDPMCAESTDWIIQQGVESLPHKEHQPFYNVLVDDGSTRYAAQENLEVSPRGSCQVNHMEVGRYFHKFCGSFYEPNAEKAEEYPEDSSVCARFLAEGH